MIACFHQGSEEAWERCWANAGAVESWLKMGRVAPRASRKRTKPSAQRCIFDRLRLSIGFVLAEPNPSAAYYWQKGAKEKRFFSSGRWLRVQQFRYPLLESGKVTMPANNHSEAFRAVQAEVYCGEGRDQAIGEVLVRSRAFTGPRELEGRRP